MRAEALDATEQLAEPSPEVHARPLGGSTTAARARVDAIVREQFDFAWRLVRRFGVPLEQADDAAQQVFVTVARRIDDIAVGSERSFVFGTTLRVAKDFRRARARRPEVATVDEALESLVDPGADPERRLQDKERGALLASVLAELGDDLRVVFVLYELEGLTTPEIAELVGIPLGTAASRLRRARAVFDTLVARLRSHLGAQP